MQQFNDVITRLSCPWLEATATAVASLLDLWSENEVSTYMSSFVVGQKSLDKRWTLYCKRTGHRYCYGPRFYEYEHVFSAISKRNLRGLQGFARGPLKSCRFGRRPASIKCTCARSLSDTKLVKGAILGDVEPDSTRESQKRGNKSHSDWTWRDMSSHCVHFIQLGFGGLLQMSMKVTYFHLLSLLSNGPCSIRTLKVNHCHWEMTRNCLLSDVVISDMLYWMPRIPVIPSSGQMHVIGISLLGEIPAFLYWFLSS